MSRSSSLIKRSSKSTLKSRDQLQIRDSKTSTTDSPVHSIDGWGLLLDNCAPNALYASARHEAPRCDEGTRIEVIGKIMSWIKDRDGLSSVLCMTGTAGSGKSALLQTIAERYRPGNFSGILLASFFFSSTDSTRNTVERIIPTVAYQLGRISPALKQLINDVVEENPLIFSQSLETQITALIVDPFKRFQKYHGMNHIHGLPYTILIDGLDEAGEEDCQADLLLAIRQTLLADDLPFRILISSRLERAIRTAIGPGGYLEGRAYHLRLEDYDVTEDLHRYLRRRLLVLSLRSGVPPSQWFNEDDIETLVRSASGKFVYVVTVFKYVSDRRDSPVHKLKEVLARTSRQDANSFAALDLLYIKILLEAARDAYSNAGRDFLLLFRLYQVNSVFGLAVKLPVDILTAILGLETDGLENLVSYIATLVTLERDCEGELRLRMSHKTFSDFWGEES
ncbi:hypothetical protein EST38_g4324 [Candolleomyces aberdarensis]|uniref:NACHT domain-containing protein n=1 Tax=Candolleomyces aberdarensis TaxID=2316362 RepID=A0A4Q2DN79_9AGAR|nr:hypothetical protein EST38_g4324 [Candolleomyces aberdarensis]